MGGSNLGGGTLKGGSNLGGGDTEGGTWPEWGGFSIFGGGGGSPPVPPHLGKPCLNSCLELYVL